MHKHKRPYSGRRTGEKDRDSSASRTPQQNELVLKCMSTWGHASVLGITEIEVYDSQGKKIELLRGMLTLRNIGTGGSADVGRLIDG